MSLSDTTLLERWCAARDAEAFSELVKRHAHMVFCAARRILRDSGDAEDVAQECFIKLAQGPAAVQVSVGGWLHALAVSRAVDRLRSERRRIEREARYAETPAPGDESGWDDIQELVDEAIAGLASPLRDAVVCRYLEGHTLDETAERLSVARSTVQARLEKAVDEIRQALGKRGVTVTGVALLAALDASLCEAAPASLTAALGKLAMAGTAGTNALEALPVAAVGGGMLAAKAALLVGLAATLVAALGWHAVVKPAARLVAPVSVSTAAEVPAAPRPEAPTEGAAQAAWSNARSERKEAAQVGACSVSGVVVDPAGRPMPDLLLIMPPDEATTRADGSFSASGLAAGRREIFVRRKGAERPIVGDRERRYTIELAAGESRSGLKLLYDRFHTLSGRVTDTNGNPVSDALLTCRSVTSGCASIKSVSDGTYRVEDLDEDVYEVEVSAWGYATSHVAAMKSGQEDANFVLKRVRVLRGRVLDADSRQPIPEFEVGVVVWRAAFGIAANFGLDKIASSDGSFCRVIRRERESDVVAVRAKGYATELLPTLPDDTSEADSGEVLVLLPKAEPLRGVVRNSAGEPIEKAKVTYGEGAHTGAEFVVTDSKGAFELPSPPRCAQALTAYHPSYAIGGVELSEKSDLSRPVEIVLPKGGTVRGTITTTAVDNACVYVKMSYPDFRYYLPSFETQIMKSRETFKLTSLPPGNAAVHVEIQPKASGVQWTSFDFPIVVENEREKTVSIDIPVFTGTIEGTVAVGDRPSFGESFRVQLEWMGALGEEIHFVDVASDGVFRLEGISPGTGTLQLLRVRSQGEDTVESLPVTLKGGQTLCHNFTSPIAAE